MNDGNNMTDSEYSNVWTSNDLGNPGWWTIKRWSEFMWFAQRILMGVKITFREMIAPYVRRIKGR